MGRPKARKYLERISKLNDEINENIKRKEELLNLAFSFSGNTLDPHYDPNHSEHAPFERCVQQAGDLEAKITGQIDELVDLKSAALLEIAKIGREDCRKVLVLRYIELCSWEQISEETHFSKSWLYKIHAAGIKDLDRILEETPEEDSMKILAR